MAKKHRMGRGTGGPSKGERPNVKRSTRTAMRREYTGTVAEMNNKVDAWRAGKRVMLTIPNPEVVGDKPTNKPLSDPVCCWCADCNSASSAARPARLSAVASV